MKTICQECKDKVCLKTGKPCKEVEQMLSSQGIHSADWIRPEMPKNERKPGKSKFREIPFSSLGRDKDGEKYIKDDDLDG